jgi:hypothetical protein
VATTEKVQAVHFGLCECFVHVPGAAWFFDFRSGRRTYRLCGGGKSNPTCLGVLLSSEKDIWPTVTRPSRRIRKALNLLERKFNRLNRNLA